MPTNLLLKFKFPVAAIKTYDTDDAAAAIKLAQEEYKDKENLTVEVLETEEGPAPEAIQRDGDVQPAAGSDHPSDGTDNV